MKNSIDRILELLRDRGDAGNGGSWVNIIQNVDFFINFLFRYFKLMMKFLFNSNIKYKHKVKIDQFLNII